MKYALIAFLVVPTVPFASAAPTDRTPSACYSDLNLTIGGDKGDGFVRGFVDRKHPIRLAPQGLCMIDRDAATCYRRDGESWYATRAKVDDDGVVRTIDTAKRKLIDPNETTRVKDGWTDDNIYELSFKGSKMTIVSNAASPRSDWTASEQALTIGFRNYTDSADRFIKRIQEYNVEATRGNRSLGSLKALYSGSDVVNENDRRVTDAEISKRDQEKPSTCAAVPGGMQYREMSGPRERSTNLRGL